MNFLVKEKLVYDWDVASKENVTSKQYRSEESWNQGQQDKMPSSW